MVGCRVRAERAVSVCNFAGNALSLVNEGAVLLYLLGGYQTHDIIESDVPVATILRMASVYGPAVNVSEYSDHIPALYGPSFRLLQYPHHSPVSENILGSFKNLGILTAHPEIIIILPGSDNVTLGRIAPGNVLHVLEVLRMIGGIRGPEEVVDFQVLVVSECSQFVVVLGGLDFGLKALI